MPELSNRYSPRQRKVLDALPDATFEAHPSDRLEEYGAGKSTLAERINNADTSALERAHLLTDVFEKRKNSILNTIRSVHTKNLTSVTTVDIKDAMQKYENEINTTKGAQSNLAEYFSEGKSEVMLAGGLYHIVPTKEAFFEILTNEVHECLFTQTEFFKNLSGVLATRLDQDGKTEVLLVRSAYSGIWQFPGGKAEYVCLNPDTGKTEVVTKRDDTWQFENGKEASKGEISFETPEECLRREISEELGEDVGQATLSSSGFYSIKGSRYLIHGFIASNLSVDAKKVKAKEIDKIIWTSNPFSEKEEDGATPIKFTDQTGDVLERFFSKPRDSQKE